MSHPRDSETRYRVVIVVLFYVAYAVTALVSMALGVEGGDAAGCAVFAGVVYAALFLRPGLSSSLEGGLASEMVLIAALWFVQFVRSAIGA